jgi:ATP-dependent Clp protease protease subunit
MLKAIKAGNRQWYEVQSRENTHEVFIYDEIGVGFFGGGITALAFVQELKGLKLRKTDDLVVHINSPGGSFFEGNTIYNYLRTVEAKVTMRIDGVAASAASIIAMAGDIVQMPENSMMFIHNPWTCACGDAAEMRKAADDLDKSRDSAVLTYMRKTNGKIDQDVLVKMLEDETWLSAAESVEHGFADVVDEPVRVAALAKFDFSNYQIAVPDQLKKAKADISDDRKLRRERLVVAKKV